MPNFTALYSFYCRPMESDDTWITTGFLIDTTFYGFLHCSSAVLGGCSAVACRVGLYAADDAARAVYLCICVFVCMCILCVYVQCILWGNVVARVGLYADDRHVLPSQV